MGLDILISTDKDNETYAAGFYENEKEFLSQMRLSREFCSLMCRQHVSTGPTEFEQIASLINLDITPIFDMEKYWDEDSAAHQISFGETEEEKKQIAKKIQADREILKGNIDKVFQLIDELLIKLSEVKDLEKKIIAHGNDTIGIDSYFSDFTVDKGEGYIGNNFGRDLRNLKRFLEYAKTKNATTVYFTYG